MLCVDDDNDDDIVDDYYNENDDNDDNVVDDDNNVVDDDGDDDDRHALSYIGITLRDLVHAIPYYAIKEGMMIVMRRMMMTITIYALSPSIIIIYIKVY